MLVVDDEQNLLPLTSHFLTHAGFVVDGVASGNEAMQALAAVRYDLLLCDKNLPGVHGLQVVEEARRLQPWIATVLMTAWPEIISIKELGLDGYLSKPFRSAADLADAMRAALEHRARRGQPATDEDTSSSSNDDLAPVMKDPAPTPRG